MVKTLKQLQAVARELGYQVRKVDGEYQVKPNGSPWNDSDGKVYFTDCMQDAFDTLQDMALRSYSINCADMVTMIRNILK